jgi:hypothetical protein
MKVSETANCVLSLIVTRFADVVGMVLHGLVRPAQYVEEILRFYCKWGKGRSEYTVLNYFLIRLIVFLKLDSQTQLSNSVLKFSSLSGLHPAIFQIKRCKRFEIADQVFDLKSSMADIMVCPSAFPSYMSLAPLDFKCG